VSTNFGVSGVGEDSGGTLAVAQSLALPDGTSYSFTYDAGTTPGNYEHLPRNRLHGGGLHSAHSSDHVRPWAHWHPHPQG